MSHSTPAEKQPDFWNIESASEGDVWRQLSVEGGVYAERLIVPTRLNDRHARAVAAAVNMFDYEQIRYEQTHYDDYADMLLHTDGVVSNMQRGISSHINLSDILSIRRRLVNARADALEAELNQVNTAIALYGGRLLVGLQPKSPYSPDLKVAKVHEVIDIKPDGRYGSLAVVVTGKSGIPVLPPDALVRKPGLFVSKDLLESK